MNCVVTFISNRTYLLAMVFLLLSFYALLRGVTKDSRTQGLKELRNQGKSPEPRNPRTPEPDSRLWRVLFAGSFLLSLLALESALVFVALAAGWLIVNRASYRNVKVWLVLTVLPVVIYFVLRLGIAHVAFASSVVRWAIEDPLKVINTFGQQMQLLVFPFNHKVIYVVSEPFTGFSSVHDSRPVVSGTAAVCVDSGPGIQHKDTKTLRGERPKHRTTEIPKENGVSSSPKPKPSSWLEAGGLGWLGYVWMGTLPAAVRAPGLPRAGREDIVSDRARRADSAFRASGQGASRAGFLA